MHVLSLMATEPTLTRRIMGDVAAGVRSPEVLDRSIARLPLYPPLNTVKVATDGKTAEQVAEDILQLSPRAIAYEKPVQILQKYYQKDFSHHISK